MDHKGCATTNNIFTVYDLVTKFTGYENDFPIETSINGVDYSKSLPYVYFWSVIPYNKEIIRSGVFNARVVMRTGMSGTPFVCMVIPDAAEKPIHITCRGTAKFTDIIRTLTRPNKTIVPSMFVKSFTNLNPQLQPSEISSYINTLQATMHSGILFNGLTTFMFIENELQSLSHDREIHVHGHSLGAATAVILSNFLCMVGFTNVHCSILSCPKVFNENCPIVTEKLFKNYIHYYTAGDVVAETNWITSMQDVLLYIKPRSASNFIPLEKFTLERALAIADKAKARLQAVMAKSKEVYTTAKPVIANVSRSLFNGLKVLAAPAPGSGPTVPSSLSMLRMFSKQNTGVQAGGERTMNAVHYTSSGIDNVRLAPPRLMLNGNRTDAAIFHSVFKSTQVLDALYINKDSIFTNSEKMGKIFICINQQYIDEKVIDSYGIPHDAEQFKPYQRLLKMQGYDIPYDESEGESEREVENEDEDVGKQEMQPLRGGGKVQTANQSLHVLRSVFHDL